MLISHGNKKGREIIADLLDTGLDAIDPYIGVETLVKLEGNKIILDNRNYEMKDDPRSGPAVYDLKDYDRVFVFGAGKGVQRAAFAMEEVLGDVLTGGHVIGKHGDPMEGCKKIGVTLAGHPVPDKYCVEGCEKIAGLIRDLTERDLVFTIMGSGCGSLMTWPVEGITIDEVSEFTYMMQIEKGVPSGELNIVRSHIDRMKGGRITRMLLPARMVHMSTYDPSKRGTPVVRVGYRDMLNTNIFLHALSDETTYEKAISVIKKWGDAWDRTPDSIMDHLLAGGDHNENMRFDEYERTDSRFFGLVFKNATIFPAVKTRARELGYDCLMVNDFMFAEAKDAGMMMGQIALNIERMSEPLRPPVILMTSGELIVTVGNETGVGGRNQEYCTAAAMTIRGNERIVVGAVDTDGTDGPGGLKLEDAPNCLAGAIIDGYTFEEAEKAGIDLLKALENHGTSEPLWKLGCGVHAIQRVSALDLALILIM